ncbi:MAG: 5'-methylthioadenosine/S-adenosylhomocysteine nucleosidase [Actinomycetaceae bacterium]|nr:5'-methylthioadenosine/S-adenosylhomocysteine nucleosidase [Actinomycetaceae bacterium]
MDQHKSLDLTLPTMPKRTPILALICAAMPEEIAPFEAYAQAQGTKTACGGGSLQLIQVEDVSLGLLLTGIGLVNAAASLTSALTHVTPRYIFATGSAGGLSIEARVGQVVIGTSSTFGRADASAFGYEIGQVPGMPASYPSDSALLDRALKAGDDPQAKARPGQFISSDAFVTEKNVEEMRQLFPRAYCADMETAALAQVAYLADVAFLPVRGVSDLCGPLAHVENHQDAGVVSALAAKVTMKTLGLID